MANGNELLNEKIERVARKIEIAFDKKGISKSNTCQYWAILGATEMFSEKEGYYAKVVEGTLQARNKISDQSVYFGSDNKSTHFVTLMNREGCKNECYLIDFGANYYASSKGTISIQKKTIIIKIDKEQYDLSKKVIKFEDENIEYIFSSDREYDSDTFKMNDLFGEIELNRLANSLFSN